MASQDIALDAPQVLGSGDRRFNSTAAVDAVLAAAPGTTLTWVVIRRSNGMNLNLSGSLSDTFEAGGTVTLTNGSDRFAWNLNEEVGTRGDPYELPPVAGAYTAVVRTPSGWVLTLDDGVATAIRNIIRGSTPVQRIYRGATEVLRVFRGETQVFGEPYEPPAPSNVHRYTVTCGDRGGIVGWWDNNIGSVTNANITLPNGQSTDIRQTMLVSGSLRFLVRGSSGRGIDQFPPTITTSRAGTTVTWTRGSATQGFGQGTGVDYTTADSGATTVFQNGVTVNVALNYT